MAFCSLSYVVIMNNMNYNSILLTLPSLTRTQLEEVRRRASYVLQLTAGNVRKQVLEQQDWLLEGIVSELKYRGLWIDAFKFHIKNNKSFHSYQTKSEKVRELLEQASPNMTLIEKTVLGQICGYELACLLRMNVSLHDMLEHVDLIPIAIDKSYPGYLASRMLGVIIKKRFE